MQSPRHPTVTAVLRQPRWPALDPSLIRAASQPRLLYFSHINTLCLAPHMPHFTPSLFHSKPTFKLTVTLEEKTNQSDIKDFQVGCNGCHVDCTGVCEGKKKKHSPKANLVTNRVLVIILLWLVSATGGDILGLVVPRTVVCSTFHKQFNVSVSGS